MFINVPKQCHFDKIFNYLETINPSYVILALEASDSRKGFNEGYHISGKEGNVPWIWTVLGENDTDTTNMINTQFSDELSQNRVLKMGLDMSLQKSEVVEIKWYYSIANPISVSYIKTFTTLLENMPDEVKITPIPKMFSLTTSETESSACRSKGRYCADTPCKTPNYVYPI